MRDADRLRVEYLLGSEELAALERDGFVVVVDRAVTTSGEKCEACHGTGRVSRVPIRVPEPITGAEFIEEITERTRRGGVTCPNCGRSDDVGHREGCPTAEDPNRYGGEPT